MKFDPPTPLLLLVSDFTALRTVPWNPPETERPAPLAEGSVDQASR